MDWNVHALTVHDDGTGAGLYAGGIFRNAGSVTAPFVARWDGTSWSPLGLGTVDMVRTLAVYDDGGGPALYAGGDFLVAGGVPANRVAKWDGATWSTLGAGVNGPVHALAVHDDGSGAGPALYVGGEFTMAGGVPANYVARWDGTSWSPLGPGTIDTVRTLAVHDDGGGPALYAGGDFIAAGGAPANRVAKWDGAAWSALGAGVNGPVHTLAAHDDGGGVALYAGGEFTVAGGVPANRVAKWTGGSWSALGFGMNGTVHSLTEYDDGSGSGPELFAGGAFESLGAFPYAGCAKWDGSAWSEVGGGVNDTVQALAVYDDGAGGGPRLFAGGWFSAAGGRTASYVAAYDGTSWSALGSGVSGAVRALERFDDGGGGGEALFVGGEFQSAGGMELNRIARWDGGSWSPLADGLDGTVRALEVFDEGAGSALYAGGDFLTAGGVTVNHVARWDGQVWTPLGSGLDATVHALAVYDDGTGGGPALYAGGAFTTAGGVAAARIARWDGAAWSALGGGLSGRVEALAVHDPGTGPELYVGGAFVFADGQFVNRIASWDGTSWSALAGGTNHFVHGMAVHDDGTGLALYVGGQFSTAGGVPAIGIARWDGASWSAVGSGPAWRVNSLEVYDDGTGSGPRLYAGGYGGLVYIASWDGSTWSPLGDGTNQEVRALLGFDDGSVEGRALFVGGSFQGSPAGDSFLAKWGGCDLVGTAYCFGDGSGSACPCGNPGGAGQGCANSSGAGAVLAGAGGDSVSADSLRLQAADLLPNQPALLFAGQNALNGGDGLLFGDGLRCAGGAVVRLGVRIPDHAGMASWGPGLGASGGWAAGDLRRFQVWYRDPNGSPCGSSFNLSNGYEVSFTP